jgi:hypothetical protein
LPFCPPVLEHRFSHATKTARYVQYSIGQMLKGKSSVKPW